MDFNSSVSKFEKEAEKRKKIAKEKQRHEAIARRRQAVIEEERLAQAHARREELERSQEEAARMAAVEARLTGGVRYQEQFRVLLLQGEDDKVILPQSALEALMAQNAFDLGPMCFRIWLSSSSISTSGGAGVPGYGTHCGVREFTAAEGTIQIPKKVRITSQMACCVQSKVSVLFGLLHFRSFVLSSATSFILLQWRAPVNCSA